MPRCLISHTVEGKKVTGDPAGRQRTTYLLHVLKAKCDRAAGSQPKATISGWRGPGGARQRNGLVLRQHQLALTVRGQLQHQLPVAWLSTRAQSYRSLHGKCSQVQVFQITKLGPEFEALETRFQGLQTQQAVVGNLERRHRAVALLLA